MPSSFTFGDKCSASYKIIGKMVIPDKEAHTVEKKFIFLEPIDITEPFLAVSLCTILLVIVFNRY